MLAVPSIIRDLDPAWKSCEPPLLGLYDPPQVLSPTDAVPTPTIHTHTPLTTPASPSSAPTTVIPSPTSPLSVASTYAPTALPESTTANEAPSNPPQTSAASDDQPSSTGQPLPSETGEQSSVEVSAQPGTTGIATTEPQSVGTGTTNTSPAFSDSSKSGSGANSAGTSPSDTPIADSSVTSLTARTSSSAGAPDGIGNAPSAVAQTLTGVKETPIGVNASSSASPSESTSGPADQSSASKATAILPNVTPAAQHSASESHLAPTATTAAGHNSGADDNPSNAGSSQPFTTIGDVGVGGAPGQSGAVTFDGTTITPGGPAVTIKSTPLSAGTDGIHIGGQTFVFSTNVVSIVNDAPGLPATDHPPGLPAASLAQVTTFVAGGIAHTASAAGNGIVIDSSVTLSAGGPVQTLDDGQTVNAASSNAVVFDGNTVQLPEPSVPSSAGLFTADGVSHSASLVGNKVILDGSTTLSAGGPAETLDSGAVVSAASDGIVLGSSTFSLPAETQAGAVGAVLTVGGRVITAAQQSNGLFVVGSQTLTPGGSGIALPDGHMVSVATNDLLEVGGSTVTPSSLATPFQTGAVFTIAGQTLTAIRGSDGEVSVGSDALSAGGSPTTLADGTIATMASNGALVVEGSTVAFSSLPLPTSTAAAILTIDGTTLTAYTAAGLPGRIVVGSETISVGGSALTLSGGEVLSAGSDGVVWEPSIVKLPAVTATANPVDAIMSLVNDVAKAAASSASSTPTASPLATTAKGTTDSPTGSLGLGSTEAAGQAEATTSGAAGVAAAARNSSLACLYAALLLVPLLCI